MTMNVIVIKTIAANPNRRVTAAKLVTVTKMMTGHVTEARARRRVQTGHGRRRVGISHVTRVEEAVVAGEGETILCKL